MFPTLPMQMTAAMIQMSGKAWSQQMRVAEVVWGAAFRQQLALMGFGKLARSAVSTPVPSSPAKATPKARKAPAAKKTPATEPESVPV